MPARRAGAAGRRELEPAASPTSSPRDCSCAPPQPRLTPAAGAVLDALHVVATGLAPCRCATARNSASASQPSRQALDERRQVAAIVREAWRRYQSSVRRPGRARRQARDAAACRSRRGRGGCSQACRGSPRSPDRRPAFAQAPGRGGSPSSRRARRVGAQALVAERRERSSRSRGSGIAAASFRLRAPRARSGERGSEAERHQQQYGELARSRAPPRNRQRHPASVGTAPVGPAKHSISLIAYMLALGRRRAPPDTPAAPRSPPRRATAHERGACQPSRRRVALGEVRSSPRRRVSINWPSKAERSAD